MRRSISPPPRKRARTARPSPSPEPAAAGEHKGPLRILAWNINGIRPFLQQPITSFFPPTRCSVSDRETGPCEAGPPSLRQVLKRNGWPHILNLQEVKISPADEGTKRSVERAVNWCRHVVDDDGPSYSIHFCLPRDKYNATGFGRKVYGVASIIRDDFAKAHVEKVREVTWDLEGRVLCVELKSPSLSILNVYAVNGTEHPYKDPATGHVVGTRHHRKLAFHRHLVHECRELEAQGRMVVVTGDLNVARSDMDAYPKLREFPEQHKINRADFEQRFFTDEKGWQGIDSFRHVHPTAKKYSWISTAAPWLTSCDRVDYILLSTRLVQRGALLEADVLQTIRDRGPSDHVPVSCSLELASMLPKYESEINEASEK